VWGHHHDHDHTTNTPLTPTPTPTAPLPHPSHPPERLPSPSPPVIQSSNKDIIASYTKFYQLLMLSGYDCWRDYVLDQILLGR